MRNKFSSNLFNKGLISLAAASVLASGAMGAVDITTTTSDFDVAVSKTSATKGETAYLTITLLNSTGEVDFLTGGSACVNVKVSSLQADLGDGNISDVLTTSKSLERKCSSGSYASGGGLESFSNGVATVALDYDNSKITTDTISVLVSINGVDNNDGTTKTYFIGQKTKNVSVSEAPDEAQALKVTAISPKEVKTGASSATYSEASRTETNATINSGDALIVTVKAYKGTDIAYGTYGGAGTFTENQNGPVTLKLYTTTLTDGTVYSNKTKDSGESTTYIEAIGTMTNGVAEIEIPSSTLTEAGYYRVYASTSTSVLTRNSDYIADTRDFERDATGSIDANNDLNASEVFRVIPSVATGFNITTDRDYFLVLGDSSTAQQTVTVSLADANGNTAKPLTSDLSIKLSAGSGSNIFSGNYEEIKTLSAGSSSTTWSLTGYNSNDYSASGVPSTSSSTGKGTTTITATATGYTDAVKTLTGYRYGLIVDINDSSEIITAGTQPTITNAEGTTVRLFTTGRYDASVAYFYDNNASSKYANMLDFNQSQAGDSGLNSNKYFDQNNSWMGNKAIKFSLKLFDPTISTLTPVETMTNAKIDTDVVLHTEQNISKVLFNTSCSNCYLKAEVTSGTNDATMMPYYSNDANITVSAGSAKAVAVKKYSSADSLIGTSASYADVTSFAVSKPTVEKSPDANISLYSSATNGKYLLSVTDEKGNKIAPSSLTATTGLVKIATTSVTGELTPAEANASTSFWTALSTSGYSVTDFTTMTVSYDLVGNDSLVFSLPNAFASSSQTIPVVVSDGSTDLNSLTLTTQGDEIVKNSRMVMNLSALKTGNLAYSLGSSADIYLFISDPNKVKVSYYGDSAVLNGEQINGSSSENYLNGKLAIFLDAQNEAGEVTLTAKNKAGTVVATKTIKIVNSTAEVTSPVSTITSNVGSAVNITAGTTSNLEFVVTRENGTPASNIDVIAESDNASVVTVIAKAVTDANGLVIIPVTAKSVVSSANIKVTASTKTATVKMTVGEAAKMTISATDTIVKSGAQATVAVTNNTGTPTVSTSDSAVATAGFSNGSVVITGVTSGTATITVTDTDGTVQSITVTVEKASVPTSLTDTTKVTDTAGVINADGQIVMSSAKAEISLLNAFNSSDATLAANTTVAGLTASTVGSTTFFKENGKSIFAVTYTTSNGATTITISWLDTARALRAVEPDYVVTIVDGDQTIELPIVKSSVPATTGMTPALVTGWNLLGNNSNNTQTVSKDGISITWTYDSVNKWTQDAPVPPSQGFWAKADAAMAGYEFANDGDGTGAPEFTAGTWSLMSSTKDQTLADVLTSNDGATVAWTFDGSADPMWSNEATTTLGSGRGYWVK